MRDIGLVERLRKRAEIRRQISTRKSVQEGKADRIADLLEEAASELDRVTEERDAALAQVTELRFALRPYIPSEVHPFDQDETRARIAFSETEPKP